MSWQTRELNDVLTLKRGYDLPASQRHEGDVPVFSSSGESGSHNKAAVCGPGVITGRYGTIGEVFYSQHDFWPLNTTLYVSDFKGMNERFAYYLLKTIPWRAYRTASAVPGINRNHVAHCPVRVPDNSTQRCIVAVLESFDRQIANLSSTNDYLLEAMETLYRKHFTYDDQVFGSIYDIADVVYGAAFSSKQFNEVGAGWPLIRIRDLTTYMPQFFTEEAHPKRTFIEPGDVVAGMDADFTPTLWLGEKAVLNQRVCEFVPPSGTSVTKSFLLCATKPLLAYVQNYATGTTVAHLGKGDLEALDVPLPREQDLVEFGNICEPMRMAVVENARQSIRLATLRDALLPKLMSGEIDVSEVELPTQPNNHL